MAASLASSAALTISRAKARLLGDAVDQNLRVGGLPASLGGDGADMAHAVAANVLGADLQRRNGALHRGLAERAALRHPLPQPDDAREGIHDPRPPSRPGEAISRRQLLVPRSTAASSGGRERPREPRRLRPLRVCPPFSNAASGDLRPRRYHGWRAVRMSLKEAAILG